MPSFVGASLRRINCKDNTRMSAAFTKEDNDDENESSVLSISISTKNYVTPSGCVRIRAELLDLIDVQRPRAVETVYWAASNGDRSENGDYIYGKKRLREIDRRIRFLTSRLEVMEIINPSIHYGVEQIFFGATVTYRQSNGLERTVTILGVDEADSAKGQVSWISPISRTLLKKYKGDVLQLITPIGVDEIEVLSVSYPKQQHASPFM